MATSYNGLYLNDIALNKKFKVLSVEDDIIPAISHTTRKIVGRAGSHFFRSQFEEREIVITVRGLCNSMFDYYNNRKVINEWLKPAYRNETKLTLCFNKQQKHINVLVKDLKTSLDGIDEIIEITFISYEPYYYGYEETLEQYGNSPFEFNCINDMYITYPRIEFKLKENVTNLSVVGANGFVMLGEEIPESTQKYDKWILTNKCETTNGLVKVGAGTLYGNHYVVSDADIVVSSGNHALEPSTLGNTEGRGNNWFGCAFQYQGKRTESEFWRVRAIVGISKYSKTSTTTTENKNRATVVNCTSTPMRKTGGNNGQLVTNVPKNATVNILANSGSWWLCKYGSKQGYIHKDYLKYVTKTVTNTIDNMCRESFLVKDINGENIAVMEIHKNHSNSPDLYCSFGLINGSDINWIVSHRKLPSKYQSFYGQLIIEKRGYNFTFTCKYTRDGQDVTLVSSRFTDRKNKYRATAQSIVFGFFQYKNIDFPHMSVNDLTIEDLSKQYDTDTEEIIARKDDVIVIDNANGKVYKNGDLWMEYLSPASTYIKFTNQYNALEIAPAVVDRVKISYLPLYL